MEVLQHPHCFFPGAVLQDVVDKDQFGPVLREIIRQTLVFQIQFQVDFFSGGGLAADIEETVAVVAVADVQQNGFP